jgi:uncharacterized membrane protein YphA (DoxX/SURF4 family)
MNVTSPRSRASAWLGPLFGTTSAGVAVDAALLAVRIALAWVFVYYGAAKRFGSFGGAGPHGLHQTSLYMSHTAHFRAGGFFAVRPA